MSDVKDLTPNDIADIFGQATTGQRVPQAPAFGGGLDGTVDLFDKPAPILDTPTPTPNPTTEDKIIEDAKIEADILDTPQPTPSPDDKKLEIKGLADYYEDRLKNGIFVGIEAEDENGKKTQFIPQTPEEFDEVIEIQVNYKLDQAKKQLEDSWYEGKSPAWKAISQYAEMVDDPTQLIPFLQGVKTIQTVSSLNEEDAEQAEQIVRARMEQRNDPESLIKSQIDALKSTDALISTAKQIKPLMVQQEQQQLASQIKEAREQEQKYIQVITDIREKAHKAIEEPIFGKTRLRQDEKAAIYDMIAIPSEQTQGYGIYQEIDKLFDKRDPQSLEMLKMVALLLTKKDSFFSYLGTDIANQTASKLQKKLTVAGESRSSGKDMDINDKPVVQRNQFTKQPRFGK